MKNYIYCLKHPLTLEIRYIGKTINFERRLKSHIHEAKLNKSKRHVLNWINSLLEKGLLPIIEIIEVCYENWQEREIYWISYYKEQGLNLCNIAEGGLGGTGIKNFTEEQKYQSGLRLKKVSSIFSEEEKNEIWKLIESSISLEDIQLKYPKVTRHHIYQAKSGRSWNEITKLPKVNKTKGSLFTKLSKELLISIKIEFKEGASREELAKKYDITQNYLNKILRRP